MRLCSYHLLCSKEHRYLNYKAITKKCKKNAKKIAFWIRIWYNIYRERIKVLGEKKTKRKEAGVKSKMFWFVVFLMSIGILFALIYASEKGHGKEMAIMIQPRPTWSLQNIAAGVGMDTDEFVKLNGLGNMEASRTLTKADIAKIVSLKTVPYSSFDTVLVSWYGEETIGRMASGETFDPNNPTICAHRWLPFGTQVRITCLASGKSVIVTVKDRGPYADIEHRHFDLSRAAAELLGIKQLGVAKCRIEVIAGPKTS